MRWMHQYVANSYVFRDCRKLFPPIIGFRKLSGREFQTDGPATQKACQSVMETSSHLKYEVDEQQRTSTLSKLTFTPRHHNWSQLTITPYHHNYLISLANHCYDWLPGSHCGCTYNQLTSKVDGDVTGSRLRWSILT